MCLRNILICAVILPLLIISCQTEQQQDVYTEQEMQRFEQDLRDEIKSRRIDIVQMKEEAAQLGEEKQQKYMTQIDSIESRFLNVESRVDSLENMEKESWVDYKSRIDSTMDILELRIDTTRVNIKDDLLDLQENG